MSALLIIIIVVSLITAALFFAAGYWACRARDKAHVQHDSDVAFEQGQADLDAIEVDLSADQQEQGLPGLDSDVGAPSASVEQTLRLAALEEQLVEERKRRQRAEQALIRKHRAPSGGAAPVSAPARLQAEIEDLQDKLSRSSEQILKLRSDNARLRKQSSVVEQLNEVQQDVRRHQEKWRRAEQRIAELEDELSRYR